MKPRSPYPPLLLFFLGLILSVAYGVGGALIVWRINGLAEAQLFFAAYTTSFKTVLSLGIILSTAFLVCYGQKVIPATIEKAFKGQLTKDYYYYKRRFSSLRISLTYSGQMVVVAFVIFSSSQFPLSQPGANLMLFAACTEYALAVYVGRKLMYTACMLNSLLAIPVKRNLFRKRELDGINPYIHVASTLTIIFLYIHMMSYYYGPFLFGSIAEKSMRIFLLFLPLISTPVLLILNFYPRVVLTKIYDQSIDVEKARLKKAMRNEAITPYEKRSYLIEFEQMSREQLRHSLQLTLTDLPIGITILIMILQPLLK
jgi:hypothetical protein